MGNKGPCKITRIVLKYLISFELIESTKWTTCHDSKNSIVHTEHHLQVLQVLTYIKVYLCRTCVLNVYRIKLRIFITVCSGIAAQFKSGLHPHLTSELCYCYFRLLFKSLTFWGSSNDFYMSTPL